VRPLVPWIVVELVLYLLVFVITIRVNLPVVLCLSANWGLIDCE